MAKEVFVKLNQQMFTYIRKFFFVLLFYVSNSLHTFFHQWHFKSEVCKIPTWMIKNKEWMQTSLRVPILCLYLSDAKVECTLTFLTQFAFIREPVQFVFTNIHTCFSICIVALHKIAAPSCTILKLAPNNLLNSINISSLNTTTNACVCVYYVVASTWRFSN